MQPWPGKEGPLRTGAHLQVPPKTFVQPHGSLVVEGRPGTRRLAAAFGRCQKSVGSAARPPRASTD